MRIFKFRYRGADGNFFFKEFTLPDDAAQFVGTDANGNEIYEGDKVIARSKVMTVILRPLPNFWESKLVEVNHADN